MPDSNQGTARHLLHRYGVPEDVIDGALCLHAQELAAIQRKAHDTMRPYSHGGQPCKPEWDCGSRRLIDLIDPTRRVPTGVRHDDEDHKPVWVTALDGDNEPARDMTGNTWMHCGVCGARRDR
ncbi:hypothetical protein ACFW2V_13285 [Streptomyces sp. NPDC058947]|uniref:hypothetical protein n=1 Tax=Streptomyces sp. NPDC058947 TaxID=3346675 RepID=UPI00368F3456